MKYGIVANPASGVMSVGQKRSALSAAGEILGGDCIMGGLETESREQFCQCARDISQTVEILVVAGGDGTVSDAINAVDPEMTLGYLPLGSACALGQVLGLSNRVEKAAAQIRDGSVHHLDLILCENEKRAIMASIGINTYTLQMREKLLKKGIRGGLAYTLGTASSLVRYRRTDVTVTADDETLILRKAISTIIGKTPSFGYNMILLPDAQVDDGWLHVLAVNVGYLRVMYNILKSFVRPVRCGEYRKAKHVRVETKQERYLQVDGNVYKKGRRFDFEILPGALKLVY